MLAIPETIETTRLFLRRLRYEDAEEIFYVYASKPEATRYVAWPTHRSIDDTRQFLRSAIPGWDSGVDYTFAIRQKDTGRFIGSVGLINDRGKIQFGYVLGPLHWGKGYATEVCRCLIPILMGLSNVNRIWTFIDADNTASARVLSKAGMVEEIRLPGWFQFVNQGGRAKDCVVFSLTPSPSP